MTPPPPAPMLSPVLIASTCEECSLLATNQSANVAPAPTRSVVTTATVIQTNDTGRSGPSPAGSSQASLGGDDGSSCCASRERLIVRLQPVAWQSATYLHRRPGHTRSSALRRAAGGLLLVAAPALVDHLLFDIAAITLFSVRIGLILMGISDMNARARQYVALHRNRTLLQVDTWTCCDPHRPRRAGAAPSSFSK